jgi:hypothetical protein
MKRSNQEEESTIVNIQTPNAIEPNFIKQGCNTITAWDFNIHFHQWTEKNSKGNMLNQYYNWTDITDIYSIIYSIAAEHTFLSQHEVLTDSK